MEDKVFNSLSKEDLIKGMKLCAENANMHYKAAQLLSEQKLYGCANSHMILAAEEGIKVFMFFIKIAEPGKVIEVESVFKNHLYKHKMAKESYEYAKHVSDVLHSAIGKILSNPSIVFEQGFEKFASDVYSTILNDLRQRRNSEDPETTRNDNRWWEMANMQKNSGFYVGMVNTKWNNPCEIPEGVYLRSKEVVGKILLGSFILYNLSNEELQEIAKFYREKAEEVSDI